MFPRPINLYRSLTIGLSIPLLLSIMFMSYQWLHSLVPVDVLLMLVVSDLKCTLIVCTHFSRTQERGEKKIVHAYVIYMIRRQTNMYKHILSI